MKSMSKRGATRQAGFTLVELVIVITILGVLAAVALPRFTGLQSDARASKLNAFAGSIRAASAQVKAVATVKGVQCNTTGQSVSLEGTLIGVTQCYPSATSILEAAGIDTTSGTATAANKDGFYWSATAGSGVGGAATAGTAYIKVADATTPDKCMVTYTEAKGSVDSNTGVYSLISAPTVEVITTGC